MVPSGHSGDTLRRNPSSAGEKSSLSVYSFHRSPEWVAMCKTLLGCVRVAPRKWENNGMNHLREMNKEWERETEKEWKKNEEKKCAKKERHKLNKKRNVQIKVWKFMKLKCCNKSIYEIEIFMRLWNLNWNVWELWNWNVVNLLVIHFVVMNYLWHS